MKFLGDIITKNELRDMFYVSVAVSDQAIFDENTKVTREALKTCVERIHLNIIQNDGLEPNSMDYTRCATYDRYSKYTK